MDAKQFGAFLKMLIERLMKFRQETAAPHQMMKILLLAVVLFVEAGLIVQAGHRIDAYAQKEQEQITAAAGQYAESLLKAERGVKAEWLTGRNVNSVAESGTLPEVINAGFTWQKPDEEIEHHYGYQISIDAEMGFLVVEEGEHLSYIIRTDSDEQMQEDQDRPDAFAKVK